MAKPPSPKPPSSQSPGAKSPIAIVPIIGPLVSRPRLAGAFGLGLLTLLALTYLPNSWSLDSRLIIAWDLTCGSFLTATFLMMSECDDRKIRARAAREDEGQHIILGLAIVAAVASFIAIGFELSEAKAAHGLEKWIRILIAFGTVAGSWLFVQMVFALHYAHEFYGEDETAGSGVHRGGLNFPEDDTPDYWDFLHFAAIIGVAAQTADVAFTSKSFRRTGTVHGIVAFVFNTVVLALTINLLASLF